MKTLDERSFLENFSYKLRTRKKIESAERNFLNGLVTTAINVKIFCINYKLNLTVSFTQRDPLI